MRTALEDALATRGLGGIESLRPVGGGCISNTTRLRSTGGDDLFLKWSANEHPHGIFAEEAHALGVIEHTQTVRVPAVIALQDDAANAARWLLLEWLEPGAASARTWSELGASLAAMHRVRADAPGWPRANFIGSLPQSNERARDWPDFWRTRRLEPQLRGARDAGRLDARDVARFDRLLAALDDVLAVAGAEGASLLHGDLWSGNVHLTRAGAALVDPAAYYGHREVDLAMAELFGGFDPGFREGYEAAWPLQPGYAERRRAIYQLYYLLVHVNLFGGSYRAQTVGVLRSAGF